jgi:hypothetical protein
MVDATLAKPTLGAAVSPESHKARPAPAFIFLVVAPLVVIIIALAVSSKTHSGVSDASRSTGSSYKSERNSKDNPPPPRYEDGAAMCELVYQSVGSGEVDRAAANRFGRALGAMVGGKGPKPCEASEAPRCVASLQSVIDQCRRLRLYPPR